MLSLLVLKCWLSEMLDTTAAFGLCVRKESQFYPLRTLNKEPGQLQPQLQPQPQPYPQPQPLELV